MTGIGLGQLECNRFYRDGFNSFNVASAAFSAL